MSTERQFNPSSQWFENLESMTQPAPEPQEQTQSYAAIFANHARGNNLQGPQVRLNEVLENSEIVIPQQQPQPEDVIGGVNLTSQSLQGMPTQGMSVSFPSKRGPQGDVAYGMDSMFSVGKELFGLLSPKGNDDEPVLRERDQTFNPVMAPRPSSGMGGGGLF